MMPMKITLGAMGRSPLSRAAVYLLSGVALAYCTVLVQAQAAPSGKAGQPPVKKAAAAQNPGERKFQENCGRCHTAPEQLSPRIAGTVVRHMRVRASLSAETERDILRFLAP
jgi:mono/diheme cytochrome c family protein